MSVGLMTHAPGLPAPSRRRTGGGWFALLLALWLLLGLSGCGNQVELMASMPEGEANEVLGALQNAGISAKKIPGKEGMVGLSIEAADVGRAVDLLRLKGLPRERFAGMGQVFRKEGLISSPLEERARYIYALSQELGATITQIDGVIVARVHVVLPERGVPGDPNMPSSAAVFIKHQEGYSLDTVLPQVRRLVTNSIPGLSADRVSIVLVGAQAPGPVAGAASGAEAASAPAALSATTGVPLTVAAGLAALLLLSLVGIGLLAWKYWWPQRAAAATSAAAAAGGSVRDAA